jgi:hypothetical protein
VMLTKCRKEVESSMTMMSFCAMSEPLSGSSVDPAATDDGECRFRL